MREIGRTMQGIRHHHEIRALPAPALVYTVASRAEAERVFACYMEDHFRIDPKTGRQLPPPRFPKDKTREEFRLYGETIIIEIKERTA
jgi:hypothetical protein